MFASRQSSLWGKNKVQKGNVNAPVQINCPGGVRVAGLPYWRELGAPALRPQVRGWPYGNRGGPGPAAGDGSCGPAGKGPRGDLPGRGGSPAVAGQTGFPADGKGW